MGLSEIEAFHRLERDLRARLRAHRLSQSFIDRNAEDALQRGVVEYLRAREAGTEIREPAGFVLQAAFRRAIDELRREARAAEGVDVERLLDEAGHTQASAEEIAVEGITTSELRKAIDVLPTEERQALCLHYFEELSAARAAKLLYCSERTFRRRLRQALGDLAELLGAPAPQPGSHRGLEIGLAAWAGLRGGRAVVSSSPLDHIAGPLGSLPSLPGRVLGRLRGTGAEVAASEAPERIGAIAAGPAGKVIGGCAGAALVCALSGVVGPGVQLGSSQTGGGVRQEIQRPVVHQQQVSRKPLVVGPRTVPPKEPEPMHVTEDHSPTPTGPAARHRHQADRHRSQPSHHQSSPVEEAPSEAQQVEEQFSGIAQASAEAEAETSTSTSEGKGTSVQEAAPARSTAPTESTHAASPEERQVEEQFRGPLAR
jgi:RNA polymerase sigma factor (sigma-70 family)